MALAQRGHNLDRAARAEDVRMAVNADQKAFAAFHGKLVKGK